MLSRARHFASTPVAFVIPNPPQPPGPVAAFARV